MRKKSLKNINIKATHQLLLRYDYINLKITRMKKKIIVLTGVVILSFSCKKETTSPTIDSNNSKVEVIPKGKYSTPIKDVDGNSYKTVQIGTQIWMAENLRKTHFNNGEKINFTEDKENWKPSNQGVACAYNFDSITYKKQGYYYSWRIVNDKRGICPIGWNVPKDTEWKLLAKELKNDQVPIKLIENNPLHWKNIIDTTNQNNVGFTAIPSGLVKEDGSFQDVYTTSYWWSNSIFFDIFSCYFKIDLEKQIHDHPNGNQNLGMPIRCVKD
jgi:uncharacterized protein (TIGR02145 family)